MDSVKSLRAKVEELQKKLNKYKPRGLIADNFHFSEGTEGSIYLMYDEKDTGNDWFVLEFTKDGAIMLFEGIDDGLPFKVDKNGCVKVLKERA